jgi:hypothetical protein
MSADFFDSNIFICTFDTTDTRKSATARGLIAAAALQARCDRLLTEDLQDGQRIEGPLIENPFKD